MKFYTYLLFPLMLLSTALFAQTDTACIKIDNWIGKQLTYRVAYGGDTGQITLDIVQLDEELKFKFEILNEDNEKSKGSVHVLAEALSKAIGLDFFFSEGEIELQDKTSFCLSKNCFSELSKGGHTKIAPYRNEEELVLLHKQEISGGYLVALQKEAGKKVQLAQLSASSEDKEVNCLILDNPAFPLILKMNYMANIWLTSISSR